MRTIYLILPVGDYLADMRSALSRLSFRTQLDASREHALLEGLDPDAPNELWVEDSDSYLTFLVRPTIANEYEPTELANIAALLPPPHTYITVDFRDEAFMLKVMAAVARLPATQLGLVDDEEGTLVPMRVFADRA